MAFPIFDLTRAPPGKMTMPSIMGGAVEGGRSTSGVLTAVDMTGGGLVTVKYSSVSLGNQSPAGLKYWSQLAGILNSGVRSILVPLLTDFIAPQGWGVSLAAPANVNDGTITINVQGEFLTEDGLVGGEWFGINHVTKANRAYVITDIDAVVQNTDGSTNYTVGIRPPVREATAAGVPVNFNQPLCLMRLAPGTTLSADVESFWWSTPDVSFVESFGTT